jgi:hypothetical protein
MRAIVLVSVLLGACAASAPTAPVSANGAPDWMAGYWLSCDGGRETAENWIGAGAGVLLGANLSGGAYEFLRIADNGAGGLSYFSMPDGRSPPTAFAMVENTGARAVFENPAHDFPQRIIYERDRNVMIARIEGPINGRAESMQWRFARAALDARSP